MEDFAKGYYLFCTWVTRFAYVNLLWILFSVIGLLVFGILPATAAMFTVIRKWVFGEQEIPIFKVFLRAFRAEFFKANLLGYIILIIGYILYIDLQFLRSQDQLFYSLLSFGILVLFFIYFVTLLYVFPLFSHFDLKIIHYIKWGVIIGIIHPILTLAMGVGVALIYYITVDMIPVLAPFFSGSLSAFVLMWGTSKVFPKLLLKGEGVV